MSRYNELLQERADIVAAGRARFDLAESETRDLSEEERTQDDTADERLRAVGTQLSLLERQRDRESGLPSEATIEDVGAAVAEAEQIVRAPTPFSREGRPWKVGFGEQMAAVARWTRDPSATMDTRLQEIMAQTDASESVPSAGGFLVQEDFSAELMKLTHDTGKLFSRCDNTPISANSNSIKINAIDETSRADGSRWGSVRAYWAGEGDTLTKEKPKFRQVQLDLQKLTGLFYATDELLMDASAMGSIASEAFAEEFGFKVDDAIVRGTGAGQPLGFLGHAGTVSITKETGQAAATIVKENIEKMYARMMASSISRAIWYINQDTWTQLFLLSHAVGTGGVPVFIPAGGLSASPFGTLLGRPIEPIEQCDTLGTVGDIVFADLKQYKTIDKGGMEAASSIHVQFITDETTFRFIMRLDGQPKRNAPLTPFKGNNTLSSFLTLATRA